MVDQYVAQHPEWRARFDGIIAERNALSGLLLEKPNPGFAHKVLAAWTTEQMAARPKLTSSPDWVVRSIGWVFGGMVALMLLVLLGLAPSAAPTPQKTDFLPQLPMAAFQDILSNPAWGYGLAMLSAVALLLFIDRYWQYRQTLAA